MTDKYRTELESTSIIVTRQSDGKTITFLRSDCIVTGRNSRRIAIALAKACEDYNWG